MLPTDAGPVDPPDTGPIDPPDTGPIGPGDAGPGDPDAGPGGCAAGLADCDGDPANGCETDLNSDATCGACANACVAGRHCDVGLCVRDHEIVQIEVGGWHTCALRDDGAVLCWGFNDFGQLGAGVVGGERATPGLVASLPPVVEITANSRQTCGRTAVGEVYCWGAVYDTDSQLTWSSEPTPVRVAGLDNIVQVVKGSTSMCARRSDGHVFCWGRASYGGLGNGSRSGIVGLSPVEVTGVTTAVDIALIGATGMALLSDGRLIGWGYNNSDRTLGLPDLVVLYTPSEVFSLPGVVDIVGQSFTGCAFDSAGAITCWGYGSDGQRADGVYSQGSVPVPTIGLSGAVELEPGSCARMSDGTVRCWGDNEWGRLGVPYATLRESATPMPITGLTDVVELSSNGAHACVRVASGDVLCWGLNGMGQLGNGGATVRSAPVGSDHGRNAVELAPGGAHSCARWATGEVRCWGANERGQLGDGTTDARISAPTGVILGGAAQVAAGREHSCARLSTGAVSCWGGNARGQLGDGSTAGRTAPVATSITDAAHLSLFEHHGCAVHASGAVSCWGANERGQLGDGSTTDRPTPVTVPGITDATMVAAGAYHACALRAGGEVLCWGGNDHGALGDGSTTDRLAPGPVPGVSGAVSVTAGEGFSCALLASGQAVCWGENESGRLGAGLGTYEHLDPIALPDLTDAIRLSAGARHACAIRASGQPVCWGDYGLTGHGDTAEYNAPIDVVGLRDPATEIWAGPGHTCASLTSGVMACWGFNANGQIGDGVEAIVLTPTPVIGL